MPSAIEDHELPLAASFRTTESPRFCRRLVVVLPRAGYSNIVNLSAKRLCWTGAKGEILSENWVADDRP